MNKPEYWKKHVAAQRGSGLSQAKYCAREGVNLSSFGYWASRLREKRAAKAEGNFVSVKATEPFEVAVGNAVIRVSSGSDLNELRRLVEALSC